MLPATLPRSARRSPRSPSARPKWTLVEKELVAKEQYDQIRTNMTTLEATVQADRAALENARAAVRADEAAADSARLQLGYTSINSPLDGRMGRAEVQVGTLDPMYVSFSLMG